MSKEIQRASSSAASSLASHASSHASFAASFAAHASFASSSASSSASSFASLATTTSSASSAASSSLATDLATLSNGIAPKELWQSPLWKKAEIPNDISHAWRNFKKAAKGTDWAFWAEWYEAVLNGTPLDWPLLRRVALLSDDAWDKGAKDVAKAIAGLRTGTETPTDTDTPTDTPADAPDDASDQTPDSAEPDDTDRDRSANTKALRQQVELILSAPKQSAETVDIFVGQLEYATTRARAQCGNDIPDDLIIVEAFTENLKQLSTHVKQKTPDSDQIAQKLKDAEAKIEELTAEIARLNKLKDSGSMSEFKSAILGAYGKFLGHGMGIGTVAILSLAAHHVLGPFGASALEDMKDVFDVFQSTPPPPPPPSLPPSKLT